MLSLTSGLGDAGGVQLLFLVFLSFQPLTWSMEDETQFAITTKDHKFLPLNQPQEEEWKEPFFFIQAADTQLGMIATCIEKQRDFGWAQEIQWTEEMVQDINRMSPRPRFLVICGDLLDAMPDVDPKMRKEEERDLKRVLSKLEVPLVCVCGNHDVGNTPTNTTVTSYRVEFGDDWFSFWCGGVFFIVVNSQYFEDKSKVEELAAQQDTWLEEQLRVVRERKPKHAVVFQHIPIFLSSPNEKKEYFNIEMGLRMRLLSRLYEAGVRYVFCGHYHRNAGGKYKDLELVVTSAVGVQLGSDLNGYRLVKVLADRLEHTYYSLGTAPTNVSLPYT